MIDSKDKLKAYILEELGAPVIEINIAECHIENAITKSLEFWHDYHHLGRKIDYIPVQITAAIKNGRKVPVPNDVVSVNRIFRISNTFFGNVNQPEMFAFMSQIISGAASGSLSAYVAARINLAEYDYVLNKELQTRFNRYEHMLEIDCSSNDLREGQYIMLEVHKNLDMDAHPEAWGDRVLKSLAVAYTKFIWAQNLNKYSSLVLPGGVTLNSKAMLREAKSEIYDIKQSYLSMNQQPPEFFMG